MDREGEKGGGGGGRGERKGRKAREFIVAAAINRVYGRNEKVCLPASTKGKKHKEEKPAPEAGCLHQLPLVSKLSFLLVSLTIGSAKFIELCVDGVKGGWMWGEDRMEKEERGGGEEGMDQFVAN